MGETVAVKRVLNNNVVIAEDGNQSEIILIGKGIGFGKKPGSELTSNSAEKTFVLQDERSQEKYKQLLPFLDEEFVYLMNHLVAFIEDEMGQALNEHIHIALTDHIAFAIKRVQEGLEFSNPFLYELSSLYPKEYEVAAKIVEKIEEQQGVTLPEGEVGFIAIHIHSAITDKDVTEVNRHSKLIQELIVLIEQHLDITFDRKSIEYHRLLQHLRRTIDRVLNGEKVEKAEKLDNLLKMEYPVCYNLAWKLIKVMQQTLRKPIGDAEAIYLTIHLQRLQKQS
ncbi:PtsGHI operon antiterminator [Pontibacillus halophilus JSM 076056 = DSM 19796]|uniref:PtsGHI operon antiterminator n=1 Tax=Pontibacillus halophilus JSM 076056 = DSM 19796 TaxID=1385510 RepID=A0A0A5GQ14_9BACI|nr:PRD domain-containing protein [Pontibacillus halophilus]KGX94034.1 PtsGHI operon antiterminator [Pontibacillus halophilus JSM 076056 = DSM 19796]